MPARIDHLRQLADVDVTSTPPTAGQALVWDAGLSLWVPATVSGGGGGGGDMPWHVDISAETEADAVIGTWTLSHHGVGFANGGTGIANGGSGAQNDEINWDVVLEAGTWDLVLHHRKSSNVGIYTVSLGGVSVGTIDGYAAAGTAGKNTLSGITVATTGKKRLKLKMATKNASSSGYVATIEVISLRRTA
jgi:hypothetical protein